MRLYDTGIQCVDMSISMPEYTACKVQFTMACKSCYISHRALPRRAGCLGVLWADFLEGWWVPVETLSLPMRPVARCTLSADVRARPLLLNAIVCSLAGFAMLYAEIRRMLTVAMMCNVRFSRPRSQKFSYFICHASFIDELSWQILGFAILELG